MAPFKNLVTIVTGGASGIGRSLARAFAQGGAKLVVADIQIGPAEQVAEEIRQGGGQAIAVPCDLSQREEAERLASATLAAFGGANILCNVAGVQVQAKLHETSWSDIEWIFAVNVFSVCHTVKAFMPHLLDAAGRGERAHVVNTASGFGLAVPPTVSVASSVYAGSKHAVVGLSDAMRSDLKDTSVGVSVVCPGVVNTEVWTSTSNRPDRFGGPAPGSASSKSVIETMGQDPDETASMILEGLVRGDFYILPYKRERAESVKSMVQDRFDEILAAFPKA